MKKLVSLRTFLFSSAFTILSAAYGQPGAGHMALNEPANKSSYKTINADDLSLAALNAANPKAFKKFKQSFPTATGVSFRAVKNDVRINYTQDGVACSSQYNSKGQWMFNIKTYDESMLDKHTRRSVESSFPGFLIYGNVVDIEIPGHSAKLVLIENKKEWKRIRVNEEGVSIYEEYVKQP